MRQASSDNASPPRGRVPLPIRVEGVTKLYGDVAALDRVSLDIKAGEFLTLLGPSGSGKTTLLNIIAGFVRLDLGQVFFGEQEVSFLPPHRRNLGIVFQSYALFPHMSVAGNVGFPLRARGVRGEERRRAVEQALRLVRLSGYGERRIDQLSGGQRQRVALARATVFGPRIILMDEPLSALDKQLREEMQLELRHLHAKLGATTVYVTHDQREALTMSDRVAVLSGGRLIQLDTPRSVYERPISRFVAEFMGESHVLPVATSGRNAVRLGDAVLETASSLPSGGPLHLIVRTEKLVVATDVAQPNTFPAVVRELVYQGDSILVWADLPNLGTVAFRIMLRAGISGAHPVPGDVIALHLAPADTIVVADEQAAD